MFRFPANTRFFLTLSGFQERAEADLSVGSAQITVPFPSARLRELGLGGPYAITWAQLTRQVADGRIVADNRFDLAATQAYSLTSIGASLYFSGQDSATLIRGIGSEPGRLQVRIGIVSQNTDCRGSADLGAARLSADPYVTGPPDRRALVLNFTGRGLSESGPYRLGNVSIKCGRHFIHIPGEIAVPAN